jgi:hypothetical protein
MKFLQEMLSSESNIIVENSSSLSALSVEAEKFVDACFGDVFDISGSDDLINGAKEVLTDFLKNIYKCFPSKYSIKNIEFEDDNITLRIELAVGMTDFIFDLFINGTDSAVVVEFISIVRDKYISKKYLEEIYSSSKNGYGNEGIQMTITSHMFSNQVKIPSVIDSDNKVRMFKNTLDTCFIKLFKFVKEEESASKAFMEWYMDLSANFDSPKLRKSVVSDHPVKVWTVDSGYFGIDGQTGEVFKQESGE